MYGIISDTHCHNWSTFSHVDSDGVNHRLRIILNEIEKAAQNIKAKGGEWLFHAGDIFHIRGSVAPSVLNPTLATFEKIIASGINVVLVCGNHDAEFRETNDLGSAVNAFKAIGCHVVNTKPEIFYISKDQAVLCIPWTPSRDAFYEIVQETEKPDVGYDIVTHIALDGVFGRLDTSSVVDIDTLKCKIDDENFGAIFAGHLHKHKEIELDAWSVGSIAQHSWAESGDDAGYLLVSKEEILHVPSGAPKFVELSKIDPETIESEIRGNYVRLTIDATEKEIKEIRNLLIENGALGVTIICHKPVATRVDTIDVEKQGGLPCVQSLVQKYADQNFKSNPKVATVALDILKEAENGL